MSMMPTLRKLTAADASQYHDFRLLALEQEPYVFASDAQEQRGASLEVIERMLSSDPQSFVLGAYLETELIGMIGLGRETRQKISHKASIWGFYVKQNARDQRIGKSLLNKTLEFAEQQPGLEFIRLVVDTSQTNAIHLFEQVGFVIYGVEKNMLKVDDFYVDKAFYRLELS